MQSDERYTGAALDVVNKRVIDPAMHCDTVRTRADIAWLSPTDERLFPRETLVYNGSTSGGADGP
jgi:hypothetical protein